MGTEGHSDPDGFPHEVQVSPGPHLPRVSELRDTSSPVAGGMVTRATEPQESGS